MPLYLITLFSEWILGSIELANTYEQIPLRVVQGYPGSTHSDAYGRLIILVQELTCHSGCSRGDNASTSSDSYSQTSMLHILVIELNDYAEPNDDSSLVT